MKKRLVVARENIKRMSWCEVSATGLSHGEYPNAKAASMGGPWNAEWTLDIGYAVNYFYNLSHFVAMTRGQHFRPLEGPMPAFLLYPEKISDNQIDEEAVIEPDTPVSTLILGDIRKHTNLWEITGGERGFREE